MRSKVHIRRPLAFALAVVSLWSVRAAMAHTHEPDWLDAGSGLFVCVHGPMEVRGDGQAWASVRVINLTEQAGVLTAVRLLRGDTVVDARLANAALPPVGGAAEAYRAAAEDDFHGRAEALRVVSDATVIRRVDPGYDLHGPWSVAVDADIAGEPVHVTYALQMARHAPLPTGDAAAQQWSLDDAGVWKLGAAPAVRGGGWLAGDQHLHTTWSLDAYALEGTEEGPAGYADAARSKGLDWIMITDHSNIHAWWFGEWFFTPEQHEIARQEAAAYRDEHGWPVLYSQEMGLGRTGFWDLPAHMLVYPLDTFDAPYLENPSDGLVFGHAECEDEQVIIDRINSNGCYGFIAHPFEEGSMSFAQWNWENGATGWAGIELWSNADGEFHEADLASLGKWHDLLAGISPPSGGALADRPGFPTKYPVGLGNSDAHTPGAIGAVFTYARLDDVDPSSLREAFLSGRCIASDGPLVTLELNTAGIGDVAILPGGVGRAVARLETTPEFGTVDRYTFVLEADGETLLELPTGNASGHAVEFVIDSPTMFADATYVTAWAQLDDLTRLAMTNPVWAQTATPGDVDGSGNVGVDDLLILLSVWGPCEGCPADTDGDGVVDVNDLLGLLAVWGG